MEKAIELLSRLDETIRCTHLDMGGDDRYSLTLRSYPIIKEIELYLTQIDRPLTSKSNGRDIAVANPKEVVKEVAQASYEKWQKSRR